MRLPRIDNSVGLPRVCMTASANNVADGRLSLTMLKVAQDIILGFRQKECVSGCLCGFEMEFGLRAYRRKYIA